MRTCENCGAAVPIESGGHVDGRFVCCEHCVFNPCGCRCRCGEFGVAQEDGPWMEEDELED